MFDRSSSLSYGSVTATSRVFCCASTSVQCQGSSVVFCWSLRLCQFLPGPSWSSNSVCGHHGSGGGSSEWWVLVGLVNLRGEIVPVQQLLLLIGQAGPSLLAVVQRIGDGVLHLGEQGNFVLRTHKAVVQREATVTPAAAARTVVAQLTDRPVLTGTPCSAALFVVARVVHGAVFLAVEGVHLMENLEPVLIVTGDANVKVFFQNVLAAVTVHVDIGEFHVAELTEEVARSVGIER